MPIIQRLRVWHIPQIPMKAFRVEVQSVEEAKKIIRVLWNYDLFQYENNIKPAYANMSGLEVLEGSKWFEWENEDCDSINDIIREDRLTSAT